MHRGFGRSVLGISSAAALALVSLLPVEAAPAPPGVAGMSHRPACPGPAAAGNARCYAQVRTDLGPLVTPAGYGPGDLQSAYKLTPPTGVPGSGPLVAIVAA